MQQKQIINIGRQYGSGGREIAVILSERLHYSFYDKQIINLASKESGICKSMFENVDEICDIGSLSDLYGINYSTNVLSQSNLFQIQSDVIKREADKGCSIFVGRCSDYILRDYPNCLNIFICADIIDRIKRIAERNNISEKEAKSRIAKVDRARKNYYNFYTSKRWGFACSYDLCLNSSNLTISKCIDYIEAIVR